MEKRRLFYKCYSLWLKFTSLSDTPRLRLRRWWWVISSGGISRDYGPNSGVASTRRTHHSVSPARASLPLRSSHLSFHPPPPTARLGGGAGVPRAGSLRLRGVWTPHAPGSGRCPLEFVWSLPREREPGNFSAEKGEAFGLGRVRERVVHSSSSLLTWHAAWRMSRATSPTARPWLPRGAGRGGRSAGRRRSARIPRWESARAPLSSRVSLRNSSPCALGPQPWPPSPGPNSGSLYSGVVVSKPPLVPVTVWKWVNSPDEKYANRGFISSAWELCSEHSGRTVTVVILCSPNL